MRDDPAAPSGASNAEAGAAELTVLYFAWVRERVGAARETLRPPAEVATAGDLAAWLTTRGPRYAAAFDDLAAIRVALDQTHAELDAPLAGVREVAFFPPVTGG